MTALRRVLVYAVLGWVALGGASAAGAAEGQVVKLAEADREAIEALLGQGVVGDPVAAAPLTAKLAAPAAGTWVYEIVGGKGKGGTEQQLVKQLKRDPSATSWRYAVGDQHVLYLKQAEDGGLGLLSEEDSDQGVISRFAPAEPLLIPGLKAGESKEFTIDVKVYDLSNPKDVSHTGSLKLTYSYLGAYQVTTPAGTHDAALLKWVYKGKVGPASVDDTQYRFVAENVGMVAGIDRTKISALLIYHDDSKSGKVLKTRP